MQRVPSIAAGLLLLGCAGSQAAPAQPSSPQPQATQEPASLACTGRFANGAGASIEIADDGSATMTFSGATASCEATPGADGGVALVCSGKRQGGHFASDCSSATFGGIRYDRT